MAFHLLRSLDADDVFISYSRHDGAAYLTGLDAALSARGFACFTDRRGTDANRLPPETLFQKIRLCKTLVLLATTGAVERPENIAREVSEFAESNGTARIVCVSFDRDREWADWSEAPWYVHVEGKARERAVTGSSTHLGHRAHFGHRGPGGRREFPPRRVAEQRGGRAPVRAGAFNEVSVPVAGWLEAAYRAERAAAVRPSRRRLPSSSKKTA